MIYGCSIRTFSLIKVYPVPYPDIASLANQMMQFSFYPDHHSEQFDEDLIFFLEKKI